MNNNLTTIKTPGREETTLSASFPIENKISKLKDKIAKGFGTPEIDKEIERLEEIEYNKMLPEDEEMQNIIERIWNFSQKNKVSFEDSSKVLLITMLNTLDMTLHNHALEICTSINERRGRY